MELLIAVLIAFGVVSGNDANKLAQDSNAVNELIQKNDISQKQINDYELGIIDMEDTDM